MLKKFLSSSVIIGSGSPSIEKAFFTSSSEKSFSVSSKNSVSTAMPVWSKIIVSII
jgi:hypothetical protein